MTSRLVERLADRPILRQVAWPLAAFLATAVAGVVGFMLLGGIGPAEALFWLLDPTSIELHFERHPGPESATKLFAVLVAAGLVLSTVWMAEAVLGALLGGQIGEGIRRAQEERRIMDTQDHVIVCGYGMYGRTVAGHLAEAGFEILVVEIDKDEADRARQDGFLAITGDARQEQVLSKAEVEDARALVAGVDDSNVNIQVTIVAKEMAPGLSATVRVGDEMYESLARRAGADHVVIPEIVTGELIANRIQAASVSMEV